MCGITYQFCSSVFYCKQKKKRKEKVLFAQAELAREPLSVKMRLAASRFFEAFFFTALFCCPDLK